MDDSSNKRAPNFTLEETEKLKIWVQKFTKIVESKKSGALSNKEKMDGWKKIETHYNADNSGVFRSYIVLKKKWENLKKSCKRKYADMRTYRGGTGGGAPKDFVFTPVEETILEVIGPQATGNQSVFDCDVDGDEFIIENNNSNEKIDACEVEPTNASISKIEELSEDIQDYNEKENLEKSVVDNIIINTGWSNYTPKMLKKPLSKPLKLDKMKDRNSTRTQKVEDAKLELLNIQKTQFVKESELRIQHMKKEHYLKMKKLRLEIAELDKN